MISKELEEEIMDHYNLEQFGYLPDGDDDEEELKKNPQYNYFCENIKQDENEESYLVQIPISSDISLVLRYEEKKEESFENVDRTRDFKINLKREKAKVSGNLGGFSGKAIDDTPKALKGSLEVGNEGSKKRVRYVPGQERKSGDDENELEKGADADQVSYKSSGEPLKTINYVVTDERRAKFPNSLDKSGMNNELSYEKDHTSTHHKNIGSGSDVEAFTLNNMPLHEGDYTPFAPSKCYQSLAAEESRDTIGTSSRSRFREKLMALLKTPYDQNEFDNLWRKVTERKSEQGDRDLHHRRMKNFSTKTKEKSHLDRSQDLRMKIDEFRSDGRKILSLLRGFFFWLENTGHEGAFEPWSDTLFLKALG